MSSPLSLSPPLSHFSEADDGRRCGEEAAVGRGGGTAAGGGNTAVRILVAPSWHSAAGLVLEAVREV